MAPALSARSSKSKGGLFGDGCGLFRLLGLRRRLTPFGRLDAEPLVESFDATFRVYQFLPAGEERLAVIADFDVQLLLRGPGLPRCAERATRLDRLIPS